MNVKTKQPWPTKKAMEQIYELHLWGGKEFDFYSGEGSHHPLIVNPYLEAVTSFLTDFKEPLTLCDLGCGDFKIGKELIPYVKAYTAVDIVTPLIERNQNNFKSENLAFQCLDIAKDDLPKADCAIVRQVLQHLSNAEIKSVVDKMSNFKYIILTEHLPAGDFVPNKDIISGQGIRIKKNSGVDLLAPPFNLKAIEERELTRIVLETGKGVIVTKIYTILPNA